MKKNVLIIFTNSYPFGTGEQYLDNEIPYYSKDFRRIVFIPIEIKEGMREVPENSEILNIHPRVNYSRKKYLSLIPKFNSLYRSEKKIRKSNIGGTLKEHFKLLYNAEVYAEAIVDWLEKAKIEANEVVFYSYWFYHWVTVMAQIKEKTKGAKFVSRAHLYDTYDHLQYNYWAGLKLKNLDSLVCISDHANNYLRHQFQFNNKAIQTIRLGVKEREVINPKNGSDQYVFVSCSSIRTDKRLDFIIEVLKETSLKVKWIHFGDGPLKEEIANKAKELPINIETEFRGFVANKEVLKFYEKSPIDLFINLSSREGIPVSLMEAISFGIPVVGTNVFGTPELVNSETGILIDVEENPENVANKIQAFLGGRINREKIAQFQKENYSSSKNYEDFKRILNS